MGVTNAFVKKVESVMHAGGKGSLFSLESFLLMLSYVYGRVVKLREISYKIRLLRPYRLPCKVISVGNITMGGTGKTPMAMYVAAFVHRLGYKVAVISRGYKGNAEKTGGIVSDGRSIHMGPEAAGDEPFMIATRLKQVPVIVGQNRLAAGRMALKAFDSDVLVLDDAFQHLKLVRDVDLVLLDDRCPFGNTHLIPRGTLREPISAISRGDAFILTRSDRLGSTTATRLKKIIDDRPVFRSFHTPKIHMVVESEANKSDSPSLDLVSCEPKFLEGRDGFAFSGIARNKDFQATVTALGCKLKGFLEFPDHYRYSNKDLLEILQASVKAGAQVLLTTEKDFVRITQRIPYPMDFVVIGIETDLGTDADAFYDFIRYRLFDT